MPYITPEARTDLIHGSADPVTAGELNYVITLELIAYVDRLGLRYQTINDVVGALESAKLEFYRRVAAPYETGKIVENGDVY